MFEITRNVYAGLVALSYDEYPLEACGLVAGPPRASNEVSDRGRIFYPCRNVDRSAQVYTIDPRDHLAAEDDADDRSWTINAVVHSHTHSEPYPSPTDVAGAFDPSWHYVIVGLKREAPEVRSYRIVDGAIIEEQLAIV